MAEWFEDWFSTDEYLYVYRHRNDDDARNLFNLILTNTKLPTKASVLDLACGTGRHSILFAQNGFNVTSVDISVNLLEVARKSSAKLGLKINFLRDDIRHLDLSRKFHLIVNLFTSFGYFESDDENEKVIKIAIKHLIENGYFILDFFNINYLRRNLIPTSYDKVGNSIIKQERVFINNRLIKKITVSRDGKERYYHESVRAYKISDLSNLIVKNDLRMIKIFGDYSGNDFTEDVSPRIIIITSK